jgi:hypothetical protein
MSLATILLIIALVCAVLATVGVELPRLHFGWLALALYFLVLLIGGASPLLR